MGTFSVNIQIGNINRGEFEELCALVDTGATTTVIPASILRDMGVSPTASHTFKYASGEEAELDMAEIRVRVQSGETATWVVFGNDDATPSLGAYTLEGSFWGVDPYNRRLIPVRSGHSVLKRTTPLSGPRLSASAWSPAARPQI